MHEPKQHINDQRENRLHFGYALRKSRSEIATKVNTTQGHPYRASAIPAVAILWPRWATGDALPCIPVDLLSLRKPGRRYRWVYECSTARSMDLTQTKLLTETSRNRSPTPSRGEHRRRPVRSLDGISDLLLHAFHALQTPQTLLSLSPRSSDNRFFRDHRRLDQFRCLLNFLSQIIECYVPCARTKLSKTKNNETSKPLIPTRNAFRHNLLDILKNFPQNSHKLSLHAPTAEFSLANYIKTSPLRSHKTIENQE